MKTKLFTLEEIFDFRKGKRLTKADMYDGDTNYIGAISDNNGIREKIGQDAIFKGNCITVNYNGSVGETFYQIKPFWASDDVNVLYLKNKELTKNIALYLITIIKANKYKFSYGRKWTLEKMKETEIPLPINEEESINWDYIENYIKQLRSKKITSVNNMENQNINIGDWKEFKIKDVFNCEICTSEDFGNLNNGNNVFIGRTSYNNGVQGFVDSNLLTKGQCISLGMVGSFCPFWQKCDFVSSQNILSIRNDKLNTYNAMFVISCLKKLIQGKHSYNRPIQKQKFINEIIVLPTKNDEPDWDYMENYIKSLPYADRI